MSVYFIKYHTYDGAFAETLEFKNVELAHEYAKNEQSRLGAINHTVKHTNEHCAGIQMVWNHETGNWKHI